MKFVLSPVVRSAARKLRHSLWPSLILVALLSHADAADTKDASGRGSEAFAATRVFETAPPTDDVRSEDPKDLNGYFPFVPPRDLSSWEARAEKLRQRVLVATGLWPLPTRTPLNAVIRDKVKRDGFTIEKVTFESVPGHFVTGFLFRPEQVDGQVPGVLCPHGHGGRMQQLDTKTVREMIVNGQERFEGSGSFPKLARCAQLARMGCVVFIFDMLGYGDSQQISYELAHRYAAPRELYAGGQTDQGKWGFYTIQAELRLQSIMGLQTWNAIRSLDFLEQLPDTDPARLAVTGNSGGGTQTIVLGAIDERPIASFPNGMVSVSMQGGCTCENCSLLRIGTGNVELAALMAPRPQAMTAADDWTIKMMTDGYPQLQQVYELYGKRDNVLCRDMTHFPHNFNYVTRGMMYHWFNKHLELGLPEPIVEEDWAPLSAEEAAIWNDQHPQPAGGDEHEQSVTAFLDQQAKQHLDALRQDDPQSLQASREVLEPAWRTIIGRDVPQPGEVERTLVGEQSHDQFVLKKEIVRLTTRGEAIPVVTLTPREAKPSGKVVLWVDAMGKASMLNEDGSPVRAAKELLDSGHSIIAADLFGQGEWTSDGLPVKQQQVVKSPRQYAGYTFTYNHTLFVQRVHDVMTLIALADKEDWKSADVVLYGRQGAEPIAAAAAAMASPEDLAELRLADDRFRFDSITSYRDPNFVPGAVKYGDLPGLLTLVAPTPVRIDR